jgi:hypothetical protein
LGQGRDRLVPLVQRLRVVLVMEPGTQHKRPSPRTQHTQPGQRRF